MTKRQLANLRQDVVVESDLFKDWAILQGHRVKGVELVVVDGKVAEDGEAGQGFVVDRLEVVVREEEGVKVVQRDEGVSGDRMKLKLIF